MALHPPQTETVTPHSREVPELTERRENAARAVGNLLTTPRNTSETLRSPLPKGFHYEDNGNISPLEIARLLQQVDIGQDLADNYIVTRAEEIADAGMEVIDVGVRSDDGELVSFGSVAYSGVIGQLCDFVTSPDYQGLGIGRAVLDERLRIAEAMGITYLQVPNFEQTNTLKSYYLEKGFVETRPSGLVRDSYHMPVEATIDYAA